MESLASNFSRKMEIQTRRKRARKRMKARITKSNDDL